MNTDSSFSIGSLLTVTDAQINTFYAQNQPDKYSEKEFFSECKEKCNIACKDAETLDNLYKKTPNDIGKNLNEIVEKAK